MGYQNLLVTTLLCEIIKLQRVKERGILTLTCTWIKSLLICEFGFEGNSQLMMLASLNLRWPDFSISIQALEVQTPIL
jgi:hypothetical protein